VNLYQIVYGFISENSDQQSLSTVVDMVTPTSTLLNSANVDHTCQISPRDAAEADISNALSTQFGQVMDTNLSSWEHLHQLGTYLNIL
jgi:hypothetical protein